MAAVLGLDDAVVEELCAGIEGVWPANYNCPGQLVVSGDEESVDRLLEEATARGARRTVKLRVTGAFHSPLVAGAAARLRPAVERVTWREPSPPFMSTVTAALEPADRIGGVLLEQLTAPVRFTQAVARPGRRRRRHVGRGRAGVRCSPASSAAATPTRVPSRSGTRRAMRKLEEVLAAV